MHRGVELHFNELLAGGAAPSLDELLYEYQQAWGERDPDTIQLGKSETVDSLGMLAERVLKAFQASPLARPAGRILGVEEELRGPVANGCPDLLARVDLIVDEPDALAVTDLKTARSRWSAAQAESSAEQLLLYSELAGRLAPGRPLRLRFAVLTKTKSPVLELHEVHVDQRRLKRTRRIVQRIWRAIQAGSFYPSPSAMNCSSCPFREPCRRWQG